MKRIYASPSILVRSVSVQCQIEKVSVATNQTTPQADGASTDDIWGTMGQ